MLDREALVERVRDAIVTVRNSDGTTLQQARAALAVIEPVVREECAKVAERRWRDWSGTHPDDAKPGEVCDDVTACADIATAIRGGSNGG